MSVLQTWNLAKRRPTGTPITRVKMDHIEISLTTIGLVNIEVKTTSFLNCDPGLVSGMTLNHCDGRQQKSKYL